MSFKLTSDTEEKDLGFKALLNELKALEKAPFVKVGIIGEARYKPSNKVGSPPSDPPTIVDIATINEFGAPSANIPERPVFRSTHDEKKGSWGRLTEKLLDGIMTGKGTVRNALSILGIKIQSDIRQKYVDIATPPNKPKTIERKGSSNPLIDTGRTRQSVQFEVNMGG